MAIPFRWDSGFDEKALAQNLKKIALDSNTELLQELSYGQSGIDLGEILNRQIADALQKGDKVELRHCVGLIRDKVNRLMDFQRRLQITAE